MSKRFPTAEPPPFQTAPRKEMEAQQISAAPQQRPKKKVQYKDLAPDATKDKKAGDQVANGVSGQPGSRSQCTPDTAASSHAADQNANKMESGTANVSKESKVPSHEHVEPSPKDDAAPGTIASSTGVDQKPESDANPRSASSDGGEAEDFELQAPRYSKPKPTKLNIELLFNLLLSQGYLNVMTSEPQLLARFAAFLDRYKPDASHVVLRYVETQKVVKAVQYANAVAASLVTDRIEEKGSAGEEEAAVLSSSFLSSSRDAFNTLVNDALPAWVTYSLVRTAAACLTAEITGRHSNPLTRGLVGGLSEVFTITDPNQEDNPIIYASEEFYRLTGYDKDAVIGHNCRFLQGSRTKPESVKRLRDAIAAGQEISETLLNYRRDGRPFVNVLMLAPLHDNRGKVKYYLGAQVDASRLVDDGRGVEGFEQFLARREMESDRRGRAAETDRKQLALAKLRDLSRTFDLEESAVVQSHSRSNSMTRDADDTGSVGSSNRPPRKERRVLRDDEDESGSDDENGQEDKDGPAWSLSNTKPSGGLPGIYRQYLFVRPYPSLRIVFVSQAMRKMGHLQQRPFLAHVAAPRSTLSGLKEAFASDTPVTAKVAIVSESRQGRDGTEVSRDLAKHGRPCWISATPLLDSEDKTGVWMVVLVDNAAVASSASWRNDTSSATRESKTGSHITNSGPHRMSTEDNVQTKINGLRPLSNKTENSRLAPNRADERSVGQSKQLRAHDLDGTMPEGNHKSVETARDSHDGEESQSKKESHQRFHSAEIDMPREDSGDEDYIDAKNAETRPPEGVSTPVPLSNGITEDQFQSRADDDSNDATLTNLEELSETPKRPSSSYGIDPHSGRPATGVLRMDYITSRSPTVNGKQAKVLGWDAIGEDEMDWPERSPYSVD